MMQFRVTLEACVAGNPLKAWKKRLPDGETSDYEHAPDREPPDDEWEGQQHDFSDLGSAKTFIRQLPAETTTHVRLQWTDETLDHWVLIFDQDADADHLDDASPSIEMPHTIDSALPDVPEEIPEAPPLVSRQGA